MLNTNIFRAIADLALGAKKREDAEYQAFLRFYRELVETLPTEVVRIFGKCPRKVIDSGGTQVEWHIELTATDFIWWKQQIEQKGARFLNGPLTAQLAMLAQLSKKAESKSLDPAERKKLLELLDEAQAA